MIGDFKLNKEKLNKLKKELMKLNSVDAIKGEIGRLANEFKKMDFQAKLSDKNKERIKKLEGRYSDVLKTINKIQLQLDKEISQVISVFQKSKSEAKTRFDDVKKKAQSQRQKITKTIKTKLKKKKSKK